ncbi:MAG: ribosome biogenesis GTPase Der [Thermodesulfovibrionales bacterium]|jgi:GTP-binding protein
MNFIVAIVGKPNVGKSTLFNRMVRTIPGARTSAITESIPGVTRDRNYGEAEWEGKRFSVIDTGGVYGDNVAHEHKEIAGQVKEQVLFAVEEADLIVHLLDGKEGLTPSDADLASTLRESGKPVLWAVNKIDAHTKESLSFEFYSLGAEEIFPVSAMTGHGFSELMDRITADLPVRPEEEEETAGEIIPRIAVVGRPNVGKSTLINTLLGKKRLIVSPVAGTTRDAVDSPCTYYGKKYTLVDTAGIRKKGRSYSIEGFSVVRAMKSIERADVVVIVIDATQGIAEQDQKIAGMVEEYGKGVIFLINKWDLIPNPEEFFKTISKELKDKIWFMEYAPFITTSGIEKTRVTKIFPLVDEIMAERRKRISTSELNQFVARVIAEKPMPTHKGRFLKVRYMTQVETEPPAFKIFVNTPSGLKPQYLRYIEKSIRGEYAFKGTPIRIYVGE